MGSTVSASSYSGMHVRLCYLKLLIVFSLVMCNLNFQMCADSKWGQRHNVNIVMNVANLIWAKWRRKLCTALLSVSTGEWVGMPPTGALAFSSMTKLGVPPYMLRFRIFSIESTFEKTLREAYQCLCIISSW